MLPLNPRIRLQVDIMACCAHVLTNATIPVRLRFLLQSCYQTGVLHKPDGAESLDDLSRLLEHILLVVTSCILFNDIYQFSDIDFIFPNQKDCPFVVTFIWDEIPHLLTGRKSVGEILGIEISSLFQVFPSLGQRMPRLIRPPGTLFALTISTSGH